jgi:WD40 repeat protein
MLDYRCDIPPERLRQLLDDHLPEVDRSQLAAHLEQCPECCRRLDALAARSGYWSDLRLLRDEDEFDRGGDRDGDKVALDGGDDLAVPPGLFEPATEPGQLGRLGPYDILALVGRGGMGMVFQARDRSLDRMVAIKILTPGLAATAAARRRFAREAKAAAAVVNEHVVTIHAVDTTPQGVPYLVMQYIAGKSLQDKIDHGEPPHLCEILRIGMQAAQALAAAHAQGLIHRDVKPANILLENGVERVKITDFGLARAVDDATMTQPGVVAGTPRYMAPEQARGDAIDHRADLFSLGSVLYALCTGTPPFVGSSSVATLKSVCEDTPTPISRLNPDVPAWLVRIIARLHAKDAADRYASAADVADLLGRCLAHVRQPATVPLPPELGDRPNRRGALVRYAIAAGVIVGVVGVMAGASAVGNQVVDYVATVLRLKTPQGTLVVETDDPNIAIKVDDTDLVVTGAGVKELRLPVGRHNVQAIKDGNTVRDELVTITRGGRKTLSVHRESDTQGLATANLRDVMTNRNVTGSDRTANTLTRTKVAGVDWPKAYLSWDMPRNSPEFMKMTPGPVDVLLTQSGEVRTVAFSPDGMLLAAGTTEGAICLWEITPAGASNEYYRFKAHEIGVESVAFSPDGKALASGGWDHQVKLWDLSQGASSIKNQWSWQGTSEGGRPVAFSPDGKRIALGSFDGCLTVLDAAKGNQTWNTYAPAKPINGVTFSPDGKLVALALGDDSMAARRDLGAQPGEVQVWDSSTRKLRFTSGSRSHACKAVAFSPDGTLLAVNSANGNIRIYEMTRFDEKVGLFQGQAGGGLAFRPDGTLLAASGLGGNVIFRNPMTGEQQGLLQPARRQPIPALAFSPDGRVLAIACVGGSSIELWDVREPSDRQD